MAMTILAKTLKTEYQRRLVGLSVHHNCQIYFPEKLFIKTFEQRYVSDCSADLLQVLPCCGKRYQQRRLVNNRACIARWAHNAEDICEVHTQYYTNVLTNIDIFDIIIGYWSTSIVNGF